MGARVLGRKEGVSLGKAEQSRRTRDLIIRTGMKCIAKYGYVGTSMNLISKQAKISRGPMHYHFEDKYDLMGAIAEALPTQASAETLARLRSASTLTERLNVFLDIAIEQHLDDHHLIAVDLLAAARRDKTLADAVLPHFEQSERNVDTWWLDYAHELKWTDEKMLAVRTVMIAAMRGLALDIGVQTKQSQHVAAAAMLKEIMLNYLLPRS